jgi:hypothetical protein
LRLITAALIGCFSSRDLRGSRPRHLTLVGRGWPSITAVVAYLALLALEALAVSKGKERELTWTK